MRESDPRQVYKRAGGGGPPGYRGLEFSTRKKVQTFFFPFTFLRII